ncbi:MAG: APC family permease, partial [Terriglobia bacterium]
LYDYLGYQNVCYLGAEIRQPARVIPRAIIISIVGIAAIYLVMNIGLISVIPWQEAMTSKYIVSDFMERLYGPAAAQVVTGLILIAAFASVWSLMLGYSRIPYAAALDGGFFRLFSRVHPRKQFPYVSLLAVGGVTVLFSLLFKLREVITGLMAIRILIEFVAQAVAIFVLQRRGFHFPFRMWLYPLPALAAIGMWLGLFIATGKTFILIGLGVLAVGIGVYLLRARVLAEFPFAPKEMKK